MERKVTVYWERPTFNYFIKILVSSCTTILGQRKFTDLELGFLYFMQLQHAVH